MSAFIVAVVRITDPEGFKAYAAAVGSLSAQHGGEPLVRGLTEAFLEGDGTPGERIVVTRFPDAAAARGYIESAEYQKVRLLREGTADVVMRLVV